MIFCRVCGAQMPDTSSFCKECGAKLPSAKTCSGKWDDTQIETLKNTLSTCQSQILGIMFTINKDVVGIIFNNSKENLAEYNKNLQTFKDQLIEIANNIRPVFTECNEYIEENKKKAVSLSFLSSQALAFPALDNSTDQQAYIQNCHKILLEFATAIHDAVKEMLDTMKICEDVF